MSRPAVPPRAAPAPSRRILLRAAGVAVLLPLAGCGRIALGGPEEYTPPPPGIDDLYRHDLLELLERTIVGTARVADHGDADGDPLLSSTVAALSAALPVQRTALLTGAEAEDEREAGEDPAPGQTSPPPPEEAPTDLPGLVDALVRLRDLAASAARQVSGSLARPVVAIAAHTAWAVRRLRGGAGSGGVAPAPTAEELVPTREVPATDPPSIGAESDYHSTIERAQLEEWYAGFLHEVLAARSEDAARQQHLDLTALHRERAAKLGRIAEEDGAPVVTRQAVYAIPGGTLDEQSAAELPTLLAQGLLVDHIALVGAAPFERRPLSIAAALQEAELLALLVDRLDPLPSLEVEPPPPVEE
ncbi:DUF4439 domain-containing protein [Brachybacterium vulturis]|uniref:DUF4439 domain-containing protein n=1 Tax=Brachybacterium vulturis TaxID=2017484 RepID=UPI001FEC3C6F|nr:DUF4439 domain-containing protein [Brachybacterium vulturis]